MRSPGFGLDVDFTVMPGGGIEMDLFHHGGACVCGCVVIDQACLLKMVGAILLIDPDAEVRIMGCMCPSCKRLRAIPD